MKEGKDLDRKYKRSKILEKMVEKILTEDLKKTPNSC